MVTYRHVVDAQLAEELQIAIPFPSGSALDDIALVGPTNTTELEITVATPAGVTITRVKLLTLITVMNDTATLQKIDVDVEGRVQAGAVWTLFFNEDECVGLPAVDAATSGICAVSDVSALVTADGIYGFRCAITQTAANSVHYTIQHVLFVTYSRGG